MLKIELSEEKQKLFKKEIDFISDYKQKLVRAIYIDETQSISTYLNILHELYNSSYYNKWNIQTQKKILKSIDLLNNYTDIKDVPMRKVFNKLDKLLSKRCDLIYDITNIPFLYISTNIL